MSTRARKTGDAITQQAIVHRPRPNNTGPDAMDEYAMATIATRRVGSKKTARPMVAENPDPKVGAREAVH